MKELSVKQLEDMFNIQVSENVQITSIDMSKTPEEESDPLILSPDAITDILMSYSGDE